MKSEEVQKLHASFEQLVKVDTDTGAEFWLARDLQIVLGYAKWENFSRAVEKAKTACSTAGYEVPDHFLDVRKMVDLGSGARRQIEDIALTRYACYLIAQNSDPGKTEIAFAQTYFAVQTRKQELIEQRMLEVERLHARERLTLSEKELSGIIFERLREGQSFAIIRSKGDQALFGGLSTHEIKNKLGVPSNRPLADFLPTITIKAKDFANEITNFNIKKDSLNTQTRITSEHIKNNRDVRKVLTDRGIVPEALPLPKTSRRSNAVSLRTTRPSRRRRRSCQVKLRRARNPVPPRRGPCFS
jgi:DNA-damage-inducible protein D